MPTLSSTLRNRLERAVVEARDVAEQGAYAALERLAVDQAKSPAHLSTAERALRVKLRARGRQLGDVREKNGQQDIDRLVRECAYEHWHQMLFARFLAENQLLMHPDGVAVSLEECEELAAEEGTDGWTLAARYASRMLPQIFRPDDPLLAVAFAPEEKLALEKLLAGLPVEVFTASDSLGWVYQFWQTKRKKEVNESGVKIGADELPAVTQLFTEPYMVEFLLHNTLGAWWAGKQLPILDFGLPITSESDARRAVALPGVEWTYLRFIEEDADPSNPKSKIQNPKCPWRPAAGTFEGWPEAAKDIKVLDPCCGSGHFLVAALHHLVPMRMAEDGLSAGEAVDAVLRDNLHGLEIDERCCQIAAFALAFEAWKLSGWKPLPPLHIACSGIAPECSEEQWVKLAAQSGVPMPPGGAGPIEDGLRHLHRLFSQAPTLGSLIDPTVLPSDLIAADYETIQPYLAAIGKAEQRDAETHERAVAAAGMVKAAELLAGEYTLVVTNVPYLGRKNQCLALCDHADRFMPDARPDLATMFVSRSLSWLGRQSCIALVTPQVWLFLKTYQNFRDRLLKERSWLGVAKLGPGAFEGISGHVVNVALTLLSECMPATHRRLFVLDVSTLDSPTEKAHSLRGSVSAPIFMSLQDDQRKNPDARIVAGELTTGPLLADFARSVQGITSGDNPRYMMQFWEVFDRGEIWRLFQGSVKDTKFFLGRELLLRWENGIGELCRSDGARVQGTEVEGNMGVIVSRMTRLPCTLYTGELFEMNAAAVVPRDQSLVPAIWLFCTSPEFVQAVRCLDNKINVTNATLTKVPFDINQWKSLAREKYPNGLPEPESDDPTQWLFHGRPEASTAPAHVAVARLLGYRWPAELEETMRLSDRARALVHRCDELLPHADTDGIVCIPAVAGERPAADRLSALLAECGVHPGENLDEWLREKFFEEHCQLFHQRPFIWHLWDGRRKDGFHVLVNYHKFDRALLEKLLYMHLGEWIGRQRTAEARGESGADGRLRAAENLLARLKLILAGEPPYDIFVRWKPLAEQPIGWDPDLNDGVRMNIRPFVEAGVLRKNPKIKWKKDRGKEPTRPKHEYPWFWGWDETTQDFPGGPTFDGNRWNDCHYTNEVKRAARQRAADSSERASS